MNKYGKNYKCESSNSDTATYYKQRRAVKSGAEVEDAKIQADIDAYMARRDAEEKEVIS